MTIREILDHKGRQVFTIHPSRSVLDAVCRLVDHGIGSLVVRDRQIPVGILTERDILRLTARKAGELASIRVGEVMTRDLIWTTPNEDLLEAMAMMTENKVRHLPVIEAGRLVGIISIGDLVNECRRSAEEENAVLREYIQGAVR